MTNHGDFEILCALAACGQLTKMERAELREHADHCVSCHTRLVEMRQVGIQLLLARAFKTRSKQLPKGMQERFAARAISEGIPSEFPAYRGRLQRTRFGDRTAGGLAAGYGNADRSCVAQNFCRNRRGRHFAWVGTSQPGLFARPSKPCASCESSTCASVS